VKKQSDRVGVYLFASDHFTCLQGDEEEDEVFEKRLLVWLLEQYTTLKEAARQDAHAKLFRSFYSQARRPYRTMPFKTWPEESLMFPGCAWSRSSPRR